MVTAPTEAVETPLEALKAPRTIDSLIDEYSVVYGVSASVMRKVVKCESGGQNIQSLIPDPTGPNGREDSWGVSQIHLPSWPSVSKAQALDQRFAIEFLAKNLAIHNGRIWTCYRNLVQ